MRELVQENGASSVVGVVKIQLAIVSQSRERGEPLRAPLNHQTVGRTELEV